MTIRRWPKIEILVKVIQNYEIIQYGLWMLMDVDGCLLENPLNDLQYINPILDEHRAKIMVDVSHDYPLVMSK